MNERKDFSDRPPAPINTLNVAIFTLDSIYSNYALKNLVSILKSKVKLIVCTGRIGNKKYGSFLTQAAKIIKKSGLQFFIYLNLYVFIYRFFLYIGAAYRWIKRRRIKAFTLTWMSRRYGFQILKVSDINSVKVRRALNKLKIDVVVAIHLDQLVKKDVLNIPTHGCINMHYGELPNNAGPFPSIWNVLQGNNKSAVTIHFMNSEFDKGDILGNGSVDIYENDSILAIDCRLHKVGSKILKNILEDIANGRSSPIPQDLNDFRYRSYPSRKRLRLLDRKNVKLFRWKEFFSYFF